MSLSPRQAAHRAAQRIAYLDREIEKLSEAIRHGPKRLAGLQLERTQAGSTLQKWQRVIEAKETRR